MSESNKIPSKTIISPDLDLGVDYVPIKGFLALDYDQSGEGTGVVHIYDETKLTPNPNYQKPGHPLSSVKYFWDYSGMWSVGHGQILEINGERILMEKDRKGFSKDNSRLSFYACGFEIEEWRKLFPPSVDEDTAPRVILWIPKKEFQSMRGGS